MMRSMPSRRFAVLAAAAVITTGLLAGPAALAAGTLPGTIQVTGTQLASALLPSAAFGSGYRPFAELDSGRSLGHPASPHVAAASCALYSVLLGASDLPGDPGHGFGATANATEELLGGYGTYLQSVYQFASPPDAAALSAQVYARYASCRSFVFSGTRLKLESESRTRAGTNPAFLVRFVVSYPGSADALPPYPEEVLFTADGDDVFLMNASTSKAPSPPAATLAALTLPLIARVQGLR